MPTDKNDNNQNSSELTRFFNKVWAEREDPDYEAKQKIKQIREERQDKSDIGI